MVQKVLKVGDSAAVTIPKKSLEKLGLKIGDKVSVDVDKRHKKVVVEPIVRFSKDDLKIADLTLNFINRYRSDLEKLAKK